MSAAMTIARSQLFEMLRNRWVLGYAAFFLLVTEGLLRYGAGDAQAIISIGSLILLVVPLGALIFGTVYVYANREFVELLLAQPVRRREVFAGLLGAMWVALGGAFLLGTGLPLVGRGIATGVQAGMLGIVLAGGAILTAVFLAIGFLIATRVDDPMRGLGAAVVIWLLAAVVYDGIVMTLVAMFSSYPLEKPLLGLMLANPVDMVRVALLLQADTAALMGYTGAVFEHFFGSTAGLALIAIVLGAWLVLPLAFGFRAFARKDF